MDIENTKKLREKTIVVRAVYLGDEPTFSESKEPFFLGSFPVLAPVHPEGGGFLLKDVCEFLSGTRVIEHENYKVGVSEGTSLVLFDVPISIAEGLNGIENWRFEKLSWSKYREILATKYEALTRGRENILEKITSGWTKFFSIQFDKSPPRVIRLDLRVGKHQADPKFPSTDRYHYYARLQNVKAHDLVSAVEFFEQAFHLLNIECEVSLTYATDVVYKTPKGLADEASKDETRS